MQQASLLHAIDVVQEKGDDQYNSVLVSLKAFLKQKRKLYKNFFSSDWKFKTRLTLHLRAWLQGIF